IQTLGRSREMPSMTSRPGQDSHLLGLRERCRRVPRTNGTAGLRWRLSSELPPSRRDSGKLVRFGVGDMGLKMWAGVAAVLLADLVLKMCPGFAAVVVANVRSGLGDRGTVLERGPSGSGLG